MVWKSIHFWHGMEKTMFDHGTKNGPKISRAMFAPSQGIFYTFEKLLRALIQKWGTEWGFKNKPLHLDGDLTTKSTFI